METTNRLARGHVATAILTAAKALMSRLSSIPRGKEFRRGFAVAVIFVSALGSGPGFAMARSVSKTDSSTTSPASQAAYVSPSGSDANPGTFDAPWRTVRKGLVSLYPGDTLYVRGGRYPERIKNPIIRRASSLAPITVAAYPGERPVIEGLLWLKWADYWTFDGINVTWSDANLSSEHMVKFTNGLGWSFTNGEIWGARSYANFLVVGTVVGQPSNWTIARNCIHDTYATNGTNQDHNIYVNTGLNPGAGFIQRNILFNATNGENLKIGSPGITTSGSVNVTVRNNTMHNAVQNILLGQMSHHNAISGNILSKAADNYPNIRGYQLTGLENSAGDNMGWDADAFIRNDPSYTGVADGGGNRIAINPQFDSTANCNGFHPDNPNADQYGRYASE